MPKRWIQFGSAVVAMIMIANLQYAWTLFVKPMEGATGWKNSDIQFGLWLFLLFETWITPAEGWLIDRMGPRIFLSIGGLLVGIGWTSLAFAHSLMQLYILYSVAGIGAAFVYSGSIATALKWFPDKRGTVAGFITAGFGAGSAIFIPYIAHVIKVANYRTAFLYTGILQGLIIIVAAQVLHNPGPDFKVSTPARAPISPRIRRNSRQFSSLDMLLTPHFYWLYLAFVLTSIGFIMVTAQADPMGKTLKVPAAAIVAAISFSRLSNGAGRIFWGWLSDRIGREMAMVLPFILQAVFLVGVLTVGRISGTWFITTMVLVFFAGGSMFSLFPAIIGDYFGAANATSNYGFLYTAKGVAAFGGAWVAARLFEKFGNWNAVFYGCAVLAIVSALIVLIVRRLPLPVKEESGGEMLAVETS